MLGHVNHVRRIYTECHRTDPTVFYHINSVCGVDKTGVKQTCISLTDSQLQSLFKFYVLLFELNKIILNAIKCSKYFDLQGK